MGMLIKLILIESSLIPRLSPVTKIVFFVSDVILLNDFTIRWVSAGKNTSSGFSSNCEDAELKYSESFWFTNSHS